MVPFNEKSVLFRVKKAVSQPTWLNEDQLAILLSKWDQPPEQGSSPAEWQQQALLAISLTPLLLQEREVISSSTTALLAAIMGEPLQTLQKYVNDPGFADVLSSASTDLSTTLPGLRRQGIASMKLSLVKKRTITQVYWKMPRIPLDDDLITDLTKQSSKAAATFLLMAEITTFMQSKSA